MPERGKPQMGEVRTKFGSVGLSGRTVESARTNEGRERLAGF